MDHLSSKPRLQEQFRSVIRLNHYSIRTEKSYWYWIRYFIRYHGHTPIPTLGTHLHRQLTPTFHGSPLKRLLQIAESVRPVIDQQISMECKNYSTWSIVFILSLAYWGTP